MPAPKKVDPRDFCVRMKSHQLTAVEKQKYQEELEIILTLTNFYDIDVSKSNADSDTRRDAKVVLQGLVWFLLNKDFLNYAARNVNDDSIYTIRNVNPDFDDKTKGVLRDANNTSFHISGYRTHPELLYPDLLRRALEMKVAIDDAKKFIQAKKTTLKEFVESFKHFDSVGCLEVRTVNPISFVEALRDHTPQKLADIMAPFNVQIAGLEDTACYKLIYTGCASKMGESCIKKNAARQDIDAVITKKLLDDYLENVFCLGPPGPEVNPAWLLTPAYQHLDSSQNPVLTKMFEAVRTNKLRGNDSIERLLGGGANFLQTDENGISPFIFAIYNKSRDAAFKIAKDPATNKSEAFNIAINQKATYLLATLFSENIKALRAAPPIDLLLQGLSLLDNPMINDPADLRKISESLAVLLNRYPDILSQQINPQQAMLLLNLLLQNPQPSKLAVDRLLTLGANPFTVGKGNNSAIILACNNHHTEILKLFLAKTTTPDEKNIALPLVMQYFPKDSALVKANIDANTKPFMKIDNQLLIDKLAQYQPDIAKDLLNTLTQSETQDNKNIALMIAVNYFSHDTPLISNLLTKGADPFARVRNTTAVILASASKRDQPVLKLFLEHAPVLGKQDLALPVVIRHFPKETALVKANIHANTNIFMEIYDRPLINRLAEHQPDMAKDMLNALQKSVHQSNKNIALMTAVDFFAHDTQLIDNLLIKGADPFAHVENTTAVTVASANKPVLKLFLERAPAFGKQDLALPLVMQHFPQETALVKANMRANTNVFMEIHERPLIDHLAEHQPAMAKDILCALKQSAQQSYKNMALLTAIKFFSNDKQLIVNLLNKGADPFMPVQNSTLFGTIVNDPDTLQSFIPYIKASHPLVYRQLAFDVIMQKFPQDQLAIQTALTIYPQGIFDAFQQNSESLLQIILTKNNPELDALYIPAALRVLKNPPGLGIKQEDLDLLCYKMLLNANVDLIDLELVLTKGANPAAPCGINGQSAFKLARAQHRQDILALFIGKIDLQNMEKDSNLLEIVSGFPESFQHFFPALLRNLSQSQDESAFIQATPLIKKSIKTYINSNLFEFSTFDAILNLENVTDAVKEKTVLLMLEQMIENAKTPAMVCDITRSISKDAHLKGFISNPHSRKEACASLIGEWVQYRLLQLSIIEKATLDQTSIKILNSGGGGWFKKTPVEKIMKSKEIETAKDLLQEAKALNRFRYKLFVPVPAEEDRNVPGAKVKIVKNTLN